MLEALRLVCSLHGETLDESSFMSSAKIGEAVTDSGFSLIATLEGARNLRLGEPPDSDALSGGPSAREFRGEIEADAGK